MKVSFVSVRPFPLARRSAVYKESAHVRWIIEESDSPLSSLANGIREACDSAIEIKTEGADWIPRASRLGAGMSH